MTFGAERAATFGSRRRWTADERAMFARLLGAFVDRLPEPP